MALGGSPVTTRVSIVRTMPTAIVRGYAEAGFVLAADGLVADPVSGEVLERDRQKIFQIGSTPAAYCMTGIALIGDKRETRLDTVFFNFIDQVSRQIEQTSINRASSLEDYAQRICSPIYEEFRTACLQPNIDLPVGLGKEHGEPGETILRLFLDGYIGKQAERVEVRFFHENGVPGQPRPIREELPTGLIHYGSHPVLVKLRRDNVEHAGPAIQHESPDLASMATAARNYIEACSDPEYAKLDPDICRFIGGRTHIATITLKDGFNWIPEWRSSNAGR